MRKLTSVLSCLFTSGVLAFVGTADAQTFTPIPLTPNSFTYEVVIPANWPYKPNHQNVTVTMDDGPTLVTNENSGQSNYYVYVEGTTFFEVGGDRASATASNTYGMPHGGTLLTNTTETDHVYQLPYWTNTSSNCVFVGNYPNVSAYTGSAGSVSYVGQDYTRVINMPVTDTNLYTGISILDSTGNGPGNITVIVDHADGTAEIFSLSLPDWFNDPTGGITGSSSFAYSAQGRINTIPGDGFSNAGSTAGTRLWGTDIGLSDSTSVITNISFQWAAGGRSAIFAVSGTTNATALNVGVATPLTGPFTPLASVSGFNAGIVIPVPETNFTLPYNATMDNGTNYLSGGGGATTWFEKGWDPESTNGFPVHGTTIHSFANPQRSYQMAPTYTVNMSTLVDTNHQSNNITPVTPVAFTAISFLTAGANNGTYPMTNYCILQHADGVNESNVFLGYDWFNNTQPYAWVANARANFSDVWGIDHNDSGDPRLFESTFQTVDSTAVTNIIVGFHQSQGASSTTFILGVSGTTNFVAVVVGTSTVASNVYAGQTAAFNVSLAFGSLPTYQWQIVKGGVTNNLANGPTGSGSTVIGATTPNLLVSNVSAADVALYTCYISNPSSSTNSTAASLGLLSSTGSVITQPGDPVTGFYGAPGSPDDNVAAGLGAANAIDGTLAPYLSYGEFGTGNQFSGPVGFVVEPGAGNSTITAARIFTSTNSPIDNPADFTLYGSDDGVTWTFIDASPLSLPPAVNAASGAINDSNEVMQEVDFANTTGYYQYAVFFTNAVGGVNATNGLEVGEVQLLGTLTLRQPGILTQPSPVTQPLVPGGTYTWSVGANGAGPLMYQWYNVSNAVATAILNATNPSYTLTDASATSGSFYVAVSNPYGTTNSVTVAPSILTPTSGYESAIIGDSPIGLWRLDEGPDNGAGNDGVTAHDIIGGHNGYYSNVVLQFTPAAEPGYSTNDPDQFAPLFGSLLDPNLTTNLGSLGTPQDNLVAGINGINFATSSSTNFSVEAWVNLMVNSVAGAGIVAKGYGGGGDQFALDTGGTSNGFRFYFRNAADVSTTVSPGVAPALGVWYHLVGVVDEANNAEYLYIDGVLAASATLASNTGVVSSNLPITIGSRQSASTTNFNLQLDGVVANVAIYDTALTSNQVLNHYLASDAGPAFIVAPSNLVVNLGQSAPAVFNSEAYGTGTLTYRWLYNNTTPLNDGPSPSGSGATISGSHTATLTISGFTTADTGEEYTVVVTNDYGSATATATLQVDSGSPFITTDITPLLELGPIGTSFDYSVTVNGTAPFSYQWYENGAAISGATNSAYSGLYVYGTNTFYVEVTNALSGGSPTVSSVATNVGTIGVEPITFPVDGSAIGWTINNTVAAPSGSNVLANGRLTLTFDVGDEATAAWLDTKEDVSSFICSFTYQDLTAGTGGADGVTFTVQNDSRGLSAIGADGNSLGYAGAAGTGVIPSAAFELNIYHGATYNPTIGADVIQFGENGVDPTTDPPAQASAPVVLDSGDPINVTLSYNGSTIVATLVDPVAHTTTTLSTQIDLVSVVGSSAYIGFTGADGGSAATQQIYDFQFANGVLPPPLTVTRTGGNITIGWPSSSSTLYVLQTATNLDGPWTTITSGLEGVGAQIQYTAPNSGDVATFYRLVLQ